MKEWKLMDNAISNEQRECLSDFILNNDKFSQGDLVKRFETQWSEWQGCKYSVFVNSGSSANLLAFHACAVEDGWHTGWVSQACTWSTTISPMLLANHSVQLCDVSIPNLGLDIDCFRKIVDIARPRFLFLANLLGLPAVNDDILEICNENGITIIEDCCESHGATYKGKKVGNFGKMSTFSFYYGHHMTTIEGGMICTNDEKCYHNLLLLRSHGLLREIPKEARNSFEMVDENFSFTIPGFNVRSTEINALLGIMQLKDLDDRISTRSKNFNRFVELIDGEKYHSEFITEGNSSFCFPVICKKANSKEVRSILEKNGIETRPMIAGNLYRHPFLKNSNQYRFDKNAEVIHNCGFYVGNNHSVTTDDVEFLVSILNGC